MSADDLREAVREAVREALRPEAVLDRAGIAEILGISLPKLDGLIREGLPFFWVGDTRRFERGPVIEWLKGRAAA